MLDALESVYGINDTGIACGAAGTPPTYNAVPGTCDTRQATPVFQTIPLPAGATAGTAMAINNSGDVVGSCVFDDPSFNNGFHFGAFLYQNGTTTLLDTLISDPGSVSRARQDGACGPPSEGSASKTSNIRIP
ncbi:hypothetical protein LMG28614_07038 [Paraburkholderia ultramafica]|uniref:Uncharacterized protein n=1 Tax=Paraburkholderia ultramafica TaxID=1544867 RepID=A0A6S7BQI5_9BURK|nr:hypothetical protein [Paraburkholderia ultramafica]CAB3809460.1 hypothetical protein LMG28614_07038 [Paraburkholderia ultramafica]